MSTKIQRTSQFLGVAVAVALLGTACGSSKSTADATGSEATGTPILIGSMTPMSSPSYSNPQKKSGMDAAIAAINAAGGIKGHPLKLEFCDTQFQSNLELSCARQLVDAHVVAAVVPTILADQSGAEFKLFLDAGIASFGGTGSNNNEQKDPNSYILSSGAAGTIYGAVKALKLAGATKIATMADAAAGTQALAALTAPAFTALGVTGVGGIITSDTKADPTLASAAAKIVATGADGVVLVPTNITLMVKALHLAGFKGKISTGGSQASPANLKALGSDAEGLLFANWTAFESDPSNPAVAKFLADMQKYQPTAIVDSNTLVGYAAVQLFAKVAATANTDSLDNKTFKDAVMNVSKPIEIGLVGPWSIKGRTPVLADYPRVLNPTILLGVVKDGKVVAMDKSGFTNPFVP